MVVVLGQRTDVVNEARIAEAETKLWTERFGTFWMHLLCHCQQITHSQRRSALIERKLDDPDLAELFPVGSDERTEADRVLERHRAAIAHRTDQVAELVWAFAGFWKGRPDGADEWLKTEWFAYADDLDPVLEIMPGLSEASVWLDVIRVYGEREPACNAEPVPF